MPFISNYHEVVEGFFPPSLFSPSRDSGDDYFIRTQLVATSAIATGHDFASIPGIKNATKPPNYFVKARNDTDHRDHKKHPA